MPIPTIDAKKQREILAQEQARFFGRVVWARVAILPVFIGALVAVAAIEPVGWRASLLLVLAVVAPAFFVVELVRYRRQGFYSGAASLNLAAATIGQLLVSAATGGLLSPFIYGVVLIAVVLGGTLPSKRYWVFTVFQVGVIWFFAGAETILDLPALGVTRLLVERSGEPLVIPSAYYFAHAGVLSFITVAAGQVGRAITSMFQGAFWRTYRAQQALLDEHDDRVRELTALSAEIAHELKNPLASVKGLAALLANNMDEGKGAERLAVLRREVDRMQSILQEFLNFSRPLVPLAVVPSDPAALCNEVAALHEGLAQTRGVLLRTAGDCPTIECDPRKVKQILINLVQNALEASSPDCTVTLAVSAKDATASIRVIDEGRGLDETLGSVFEPGVSSKSGGAGIGLTIARALARQHGGELTLETMAVGGCVAELTLPWKPPESVVPEPALVVKKEAGRA